MAEDVKIKIDGDVSGLLATVKKAMDQIEQDGKKFNTGGRGKTGGSAVDNYVKRYQEAALDNQKRVANENELKVTNQLLKEKYKQLLEIQKIEKLTTEEVSKRKNLEQDIEAHRRQRQNLLKNGAGRTRSYGELLSDMKEQYGLGGVAGLENAVRGMNGREKFGLGATAIGSLIGVAGGGLQYMANRPIDINRMQGSAISMTTGRQLGEARTGEYTYDMMYGQDWQKAKQQASTSRSLSTAGDWAKLIGGAAAVAGAVALTPWTGGASLGLLEGVGALATGSATAMSSINKGILDPGKYGAYKSQEEAQNFTTMLDALHQESPYRKSAIEKLKDTHARDLNMERVLGLKDASYYGRGGYLQGQMHSNFTDEMVTRSSQNILAAGGSTQMALQSGTSLQAQRGLGLTNADQLLGQLSGTGRIPEDSKKALIHIFARGFDSSKYAEENRKYMQAVTEEVYKGGSTSIATSDRIADLISAAVGNNPSMRNVEAAKTAFGAFQSNTTSLTGYMGGINLTSALQNKYLKQIKDPAELKGLLSLKMDEIDENDPFLSASAKKLGISGSKLADILRNLQTSNAKKFIGNRGADFGAIGMIETLNPGMDYKSAEAYYKLANEPSSPERNKKMADLEAKAAKDMANNKTGRAGDVAVQASAKNASIALETLSQSIDKFANDALKKANDLVGQSFGGRQNEANTAAAQAEYEKAKHLPPAWNAHTHTMEFPGDAARRKLDKQKHGN